MKKKETAKILVALLALSFVLVLGSIANAVGTINGCPENYYSSEFGCQVAVDTDYVAEQAETFDVAKAAGCDANFFEPEKGCQLTTTAYVEEYELVKEEIGEEYNVRGCPGIYFEAEKGCQLQNIR